MQVFGWQRKIVSALAFAAVLVVAPGARAAPAADLDAKRGLAIVSVTPLVASANGPAITSSLAEAFERYQPYVLSVLRIIAGLLFLQHGMAKVFGFPRHGDMPVFPKIEWFAGRIELVGGTLIVLGLFTRPVAFIVSGEMAFAYFIGHARRSFFPLVNGGEIAVLFCFVFFYLVFAGAGPLSLDALF
jgi:putative oxidoreductase